MTIIVESLRKPRSLKNKSTSWLKENYNHKFLPFSIEFDNRHIHRRINLKHKARNEREKWQFRSLIFLSTLLWFHYFFCVWMSFLQRLFIRFSFQFVLAIVINYYSFIAQQKKLLLFPFSLSLTSPFFLYRV